MTAATATRSTSERRLLGHDSRRDVFNLCLFFGLFFLLNEITKRFASLDVSTFYEPVIFLSAALNQILLAALVVLGAAVVVWKGRGRLAQPWGALEHGGVLRWVAIPLIVLLSWQWALYDYHYVFDQWHAVDRILVVGLGAAAIWRPGFILLFVLHTRVVGGQIDAFLGQTAVRGIDGLPIIVLVALGARHLWFVLTGDRRTSPAILLIAAIVASHFFEPGRSKLMAGWLGNNDLGNFAESSHTAGWLGGTDGGWIDWISQRLRDGEILIGIATIVLEAGAIFAVLHYRLLRWWLPCWMVFHAVIFAATGFWLLEWIVVEIVVLVVITRAHLDAWLRENATPMRAGLAGLLVLGSSVVFAPPQLSWFDSPIGQAYEVDVIGVSGQTYGVGIEKFGPLAPDVSFMFANVDERRHAVGAYGALASSQQVDLLAQLETLAAFDDHQEKFPVVDDWRRDRSELLFVSFADHANDRAGSSWLPAPLPRFWSSRESPSFDWQEPITELRVYRVDEIHSTGESRRVEVLVISAAPDSPAVVTTRVTPPE